VRVLRPKYRTDSHAWCGPLRGAAPFVANARTARNPGRNAEILTIGTKRHLPLGGAPGGRTSRFAFLSALLIVLLVGGLPGAPAAHAAHTFVGCGDSAGLRDAVAAANARPGPDAVILKKGCTYKFLSPVPFADAALVVTDDLAVYGNGARIVRSSKAANLRHFDVVGAGTELELNNLRLAYGRIESPYASFPAAGSVLVGPGAALRADKLTVEDNVVKAIAGQDVVLAAGGILNNGGTISLVKSTIKRNKVSTAFGPGATLGGGVATAGGGSTTIYKTVVKANGATALGPRGPVAIGGGIATVGEPGSLVVESSSVTGNRVVVEGGAEASGAGGLLVTGVTTMSTSVITDNEAKAKATPGALLGGGVLNGGQLAVDLASQDRYDRTEIRENDSSCPDDGCAARGGGYAQDSPTATARFRFTALKDNEARAPDGAAFGGGLYIGTGLLELDEAIIKRNRARGKPAEGGGLFAGPTASVTVGSSDLEANEPRNCYGVVFC
jgi:hypothetical protein